MTTNLVRVGADSLPAAFESACLVRCTAAAPALAEFNDQEAAVRLASLLVDLGFAASHEVRTGGGRRRYDVHRVLVPEPRRPAANRTLAAAWRQGGRALLGTDPLGSSSPRHAQRATLARAGWHAALLAGGRQHRTDLLWVRVGDHEMAAVLVRAARLLGVTAEVTRRPGCLLVTVSALTAHRLLAVPAWV